MINEWLYLVREGFFAVLLLLKHFLTLRYIDFRRKLKAGSTCNELDQKKSIYPLLLLCLMKSVNGAKSLALLTKQRGRLGSTED